MKKNGVAVDGAGGANASRVAAADASRPRTLGGLLLEVATPWRAPAVTGWSLRRRLMIFACVGTIAAWLFGGLAVMWAASQENEALHIARLEDFARVALRFAEHEIEEIRAERPGDIIHVETGVTLDPRFRYQVRDASGTLVLISVETGHEPFVPLDNAGHRQIEIGGVEHYAYSLWNQDRSLQIQVAERTGPEHRMFMSTAGKLLVSFVVTVAALLLLSRWVISRTTRALDQAATQMVNRSPVDLQPITADNPPRELIPLIKAANSLFARIGSALTAEHNFTANAAHELRTPLAAVRIQAQVAERAQSGLGTQQALAQLGVCVDRASRMVDQLLTLARVESAPIAAQSMTVVHLDQLVAQTLADLRPSLEQRRIETEVRAEPAAVRGLEFALSSLVRNLTENALRYVPDGGVVRLETWSEGDTVYLAVEDSGPGIPAEERERVFDPFYRIPTEGVEGCGIGLSIVRSVVRVHAAHVVLSDSALGGLRAVVRFRAADEPLASASS